MKKFLIILLSLLVISTALFAQENPAITIVNNTGYEVWYVYISQTASPTWGDDYLEPTQVLRSGESATFRLPFPINVVNRYDIQLVDLDGDSYTQMNVLVSPNARIEFTFDDFDPENYVTFDGPPITIVNNTGYEVWFVLISPSSHDHWGRDRLASDQVLRNGQSVTVNLPYPINEENEYDIQLIDLDEDSYTKWNVRVSPNARIVFTFDDFDY